MPRDYRQVIPKKPSQAVAIDRGALLAALRRVSILRLAPGERREKGVKP